jgi:hypothetical protein
MTTPTIGFIILRHVQDEHTDKYWQLCYDCIRQFYPENPIMIVDDNSDNKYITKGKLLYNTYLVQSEYPARGELLPYIYYLRYKFCDSACIVHDSVFFQKRFDLTVYKFKFLWEFDHHSDQIEDETVMIQLFQNDSLYEFYTNKSLWKGCFGAMSIVTHDFLTEVNNKFNLTLLTDVILSRYNRCSFERVIACLFQFFHQKETLLGNINRYVYFGSVRYDNRHNYTHLPLLKVWTGR